MSTAPRTFGPTLINGDENIAPYAVVRVALALSREQLRTALAISHAEMDPRPLSELTTDEIHRRVEGYLGAGAVIEIDRDAATVSARLAAPENHQLRDDLDTTLDRAYPTATQQAEGGHQ